MLAEPRHKEITPTPASRIPKIKIAVVQCANLFFIKLSLTRSPSHAFGVINSLACPDFSGELTEKDHVCKFLCRRKIYKHICFLLSVNSVCSVRNTLFYFSERRFHPSHNAYAGHGITINHLILLVQNIVSADINFHARDNGL